MSELDEIDIKLLKEIDKRPGQPLARAAEALLDRRSQRVLYKRLLDLEAQQLISVDRRSEKRLARATNRERKSRDNGKGESLPSSGGEILMSSSACAAIRFSDISESSEPIALSVNGICIGVLRGLGEGIAQVENMMIEISPDLVADLRPLVGQRVVIMGRDRAGRCSV